MPATLHPHHLSMLHATLIQDEFGMGVGSHRGHGQCALHPKFPQLRARQGRRPHAERTLETGDLCSGARNGVRREVKRNIDIDKAMHHFRQFTCNSDTAKPCLKLAFGQSRGKAQCTAISHSIACKIKPRVEMSRMPSAVLAFLPRERLASAACRTLAVQRQIARRQRH